MATQKQYIKKQVAAQKKTSERTSDAMSRLLRGESVGVGEDGKAGILRSGLSRTPGLSYGEQQARWEFEPKKGGGGTYRQPGKADIEIDKDADPAEVRRRELLETSAATGSGATGKGGKLTSDDADQGAGDIGDSINKMVRAGVDATGPLLSWLTEETDASEAPRNAGQWLMNLLSTGTYVGARALEGVGAAADKNQKLVKDAADRGDALGVAGAYAQGVGEGTVNAIGGAARGLAEGFGARFDGERPRTHGQNLEALGTDDFLKEQLGENIGSFAQGTLGTVADIGADPLTYATLGLSGAARSALRGAKEAAAAAKTPAGKVANGTVGAMTGAAEGVAARRSQLLQEAAQRRETAAARRQYRRDQRAGRLPVDGELLDEAAAPADEIYGESFESIMAAPPRAIEAGEPAPRLAALEAGEYAQRPVAANVDEVVAKAIDENPTLQRVEELMGEGGIRGISQQVPNADELLGKAISDTVAEYGVKDPALVDLLAQTSEAVMKRLSSSELLTKRGAINKTEAKRRAKAMFAELDADPRMKAMLDAAPPGMRSLRESLAESLAYGFQHNAAERRGIFRNLVAPGATNVYTNRVLARAIDEAAPHIGRTKIEDALADLGPKLEKARESGKPGAEARALQGWLRTQAKPTGITYRTFAEALEGAGRGEVDVTDMQRMAAALGITTRATKPATLSKLLATRGAATYEAALRSIPTPQAVRAAYRLTDEEAAAAADDVAQLDEVMAPLIDEAEQTIPIPEADPRGAPTPPETAAGEFDADLLSPAARSSTGKAIWEAMEEIGKLFKDGNPAVSYTDVVYFTTHKAVMKHLSRTARGADGKLRGVRLHFRYVSAMEAIEAHHRALGIIPRITSDTGTQRLYVGAGDIVRELEPDVAMRALFSPEKGRGSFDADARAGFKGGFTLFPDQIGAAVSRALEGKSVDEVAEFLTARQTAIWEGTKLKYGHKMPNWAKSQNGQRAIRAVAENITRPDYLQRIQAIDAKYRPIANAIDEAVIRGEMQTAFTALAKALSEPNDRGTLLAMIDEVTAHADQKFSSATLTSNYLNAEGIRRLNHALLNGVLGERGYKAARDAKAYSSATARGDEAAAKAAQEEHLRNLRGNTEGASGAAPARTATATKPQSEQRRAANEEGARIYAQEAGEIWADIVEDIDPRFLDDAEDFITAEMLARLDNGYSAEFGSRLDRVLAGLSGRRGIDESTLGARVGAEERALTPMAMFSEARYMVFKKIRARRGDTLEGTNAYIRDRLWDALAKTSTKNWRDEAALRAELAEGHEFPGTAKGEDHGAFDALEADEIEDALALRELIDHVMNPEAGGLLGRSGLTVDDINDKLSARASDAEKDFLLEGDNVHSNAVAWRVWSKLEDPLTMLDKVHASIRLAQVPADLGRQFSALFSSRYAPDVAGWSDAQFRQAGWKKIDSDSAPTNSIMRFMVDKDVWYPPEALSQVRYLDGYLNAARSPNPGTAFGKLVLAMDPPLHALKSLATIWRPAHHINNVMGEMAMLAIAGVSPLQTIRSFRALRAAAGLGPEDIDVLRDGLRRHGFGYGIKLDPKYESDVLTVRLRNADGSTRFEQIPIVEAMRRWKTDGVALTHTAARDLIEDTVSRSGSRARYLGRRVDKIEEPIGKASAVRDNLTRIAHAIDAMEKGTFSSMDEAFAATAGRVHDYHPTIRTTGAAEQLVARRVFMFYTWMRQAASRIIRTALDRPGLVTIPSKFQYNMAEAYGLNPESIGGPTSDDPRLASYVENSLLGPTVIGRPGLVDGLMRNMGWMPDEEKPGTAGQDAAQDLWQYSLSTPHIDTLQALFGGATIAPELGPLGGAQAAFSGQGEAVGDMLNPLITAPYALIFSDGGTSGQVGKNEQALGEFGAISAIGKMLPDPQGKDENFLAAAARGLAGKERAKPIEGEDREKAFEDRAKNIVNFFTGAKLLNATSSSYEGVAKTEWRERTKRELQNIGVTDPDEVDVILEELWQREQAKLRG